ncbi:MAG: hypothetical protein VX764_07975 [Planctomycetota bacterium]|nr:hypothetical protein [Planctomycetota bacterium]
MKILNAVLLLLFTTAIVSGQDYVLNMESGVISNGASGDLAVTLDNNADDVQGWSFGACNDTAFLQCTGVADGATTLIVNNGGPPDFNESAVFDGGFTTGVVLCFTGCAVLAAGTDYELHIATYAALAEGTTEIVFCNSLGSPPVDTVVVVNGASIPPVQNPGTVEIPGVPDPEFTYSAADVSANYSPADGNATMSVDVSIAETDNSGLGAPFPNDTQGFSMGLGNGPEVTATAVNLDLPFAADFGESSLYDEGWTIGVVYSFTGGNVLAFPEPTAVISVDYETGGSMAGNEDGTTVPLVFADTLGSPPVDNVVVVDGGSIPGATESGSITLNPVVTVDFIRGDANSDSVVNVADAIWIIYELFIAGPVSTCPISRDANADGNADIGDPTFIINYRFMSGPAPAAPFPDCGQVDGQAPEDCSSSGCP